MSSNLKGVLVTGGTGKTGHQISARLAELGHRVRVASRSGKTSVIRAEAIRFDWAADAIDADIFEGIDAVYLVAPALEADPFDVMSTFVKRGLDLGVNRYVLLSASSIPEGGPAMGRLHSLLSEIAPEWAVLRPSWFMQNFSMMGHLSTIREEGLIYSACEDGNVPFVDAADIAEVALHALTDEVAHNTDHLVTGPRAISYDTAADIIGVTTGLAIRHQRLSSQQLADRWVAFGLSRDYATMLAGMDVAIAGGSEDRISDSVERITGKPARSFEAFVQENSKVWTD